MAIEARQFDIAYVAGWDLLNYWPNFLAGMSYERHAWKQSRCVSKDRVAGVDGWNSSVVRWVCVVVVGGSVSSVFGCLIEVMSVDDGSGRLANNMHMEDKGVAAPLWGQCQAL